MADLLLLQGDYTCRRKWIPYNSYRNLPFVVLVSRQILLTRRANTANLRFRLNWGVAMSSRFPAMVRVLRDRGVRLTAERRSILRGLLTCGRHFNAERLLRHFRRQGTPVSRATVYRTLNTLVENGLLRKIEMGERRSLYETTEGREHHEHMICVRCGEIIEFIEPEIEQLQNQVCLRAGFQPQDHTLQIYGVCRACSRLTVTTGESTR
jgi:Fur family ferric uptake transcriptional regulator